MCEDEELGFSQRGDLSGFAARGVGVAVVGLQLRRAAGEAEFAVDLVDGNVTAIAGRQVEVGEACSVERLAFGPS